MAHRISSSSRKSNRARIKEKLQKDSLASNLEEQLEKDEGTVSAKHVKGTTTKSKEDPESTHKPQTKVTSDVDVNAVPDPVPENGPSGTTLTVYSGVLPVIPSSTGTPILPSHTSGFSPLPPFASFAAATIATSVSSATQSAHSVSSVSSGPKQSETQSQPPRHIPTVIIVLVTIGVSFLLLVLFIVTFKMCNKPRKRTCPTPSLPILQDPFTDKAWNGDEESLFGGKERISGRPGSNGLWTWTQYSHPSMIKSDATVCGNGAYEKSFDPAVQLTTAIGDAKQNSPYDGFSARETPKPAPVQQAPNAMTRAAKRVSAMSMSIYPGSPQSIQGSTGIGFAVGSASPLTADGAPLLQRSTSKATRRLSRNRRSMRYSVHEEHEGIEADPGDVYEGLQPMSPVAMAPTAALRKSNSAQGQGRARVKTPYAPGAVLRASSTVAALAGGHSNPFSDSQYILPPLSPALKTDALRERDTKALTSALGLASPPPPSPQPTLYPDDSITLAGDRRKHRTGSQTRPQSQMMSPSTEASARLGNLMLGEFSSMASIPSARTLAGPVDNALGVTRSKSGRKRADDKPPRVPSPPPMPSLAQMAMAHTNPDEFTDYRSPTYSIYGLYEADRKSRAPGEGGY